MTNASDALVRRSNVHSERHAEEGELRAALELMPQLVWTTTADGYHDYYNEQWYAFTGMPRPGDARADAEGWNWNTYLHPDDYEPTLKIWTRSLATGEPYETEYRFKEAATGSYRWFLARALPQRNSAGAIIRWFGTCTDIHDHKRALDDLNAARVRLQEQHAELEASNQQLQEQQIELEMQAETLQSTTAELEIRSQAAEVAEGQLQAAFAQAPVAVAVTIGMDHRFAVANQKYEELIGRSVPHGSTYRDILPDAAAQGYADMLDRVYASGEPIVGNETHAWLSTGTSLAREGWYDFAFQPLVNAAGGVMGIMQLAVDVSDRVLARRSMEHLLAEAGIRERALEEARLEAVTARTEAESARQLAEVAQQEAEAANQAKAVFLTTMSHEFRTPLNAIGGYSELIETGLRGPTTAEQRADLERIQRSQRHLLGLINGILNYARIDAGVVHYDITNVDLDDVFATCEALITPQMRCKGQTFRSVSAEGMYARGDHDKVQQVVVNLLSNAVKFTDPGGQIELRCHAPDGQDGGKVRIIVSDHGRGIDPDQLERIFEPFVQIDARLTRTQEGTGLGLAISRDLARAMGGDLTALSTPGVGSTFTLTLPAGQSD